MFFSFPSGSFEQSWIFTGGVKVPLCQNSEEMFISGFKSDCGLATKPFQILLKRISFKK